VNNVGEEMMPKAKSVYIRLFYKGLFGFFRLYDWRYFVGMLCLSIPPIDNYQKILLNIVN
jgi:hypothetical protein